MRSADETTRSENAIVSPSGEREVAAWNKATGRSAVKQSAHRPASDRRIANQQTARYAASAARRAATSMASKSPPRRRTRPTAPTCGAYGSGEYQANDAVETNGRPSAQWGS